MKANSTLMRASDIAICTFLIIFETLMRNDQEMMDNEWEILFMTINDLYNPLSFAIHEWSVIITYKTILSC
jgi:hypothetical protein